MILTERNRSTRRTICSSAALSITSTTWNDLGLNPTLLIERPVTDRLSMMRLVLCRVTFAARAEWVGEFCVDIRFV